LKARVLSGPSLGALRSRGASARRSHGAPTVRTGQLRLLGSGGSSARARQPRLSGSGGSTARTGSLRRFGSGWVQVHGSGGFGRSDRAGSPCGEGSFGCSDQADPHRTARAASVVRTARSTAWRGQLRLLGPSGLLQASAVASAATEAWVLRPHRAASAARRERILRRCEALRRLGAGEPLVSLGGLRPAGGAGALPRRASARRTEGDDRSGKLRRIGS
jgi:hypothetical protein